MSTRLLKPTRLLGRSMTEEGVTELIRKLYPLTIFFKKNLQNVINRRWRDKVHLL